MLRREVAKCSLPLSIYVEKMGKYHDVYKAFVS